MTAKDQCLPTFHGASFLHGQSHIHI